MTDGAKGDRNGVTHGLRLESPIGMLWLESDGSFITAISFNAHADADLDPTELLQRAARQLDEYFAGHRRAFDLPVRAGGTPFQRSVWEAVAGIPWGATSSYQQIANAVGGRAVARAVGTANGANPLPIIVPCHRVLGSDGSLTGYAGGLWRKRWLLQHEGVIGRSLFEGP